MKEWVKALYIGYHQALDLPKNLFPFPRTGHLKISLGPTYFLYSKWRLTAVSLITILMKSYKFKLFKLYVLDKNDVVYAKNHNVAKDSFL